MASSFMKITVVEIPSPEVLPVRGGKARKIGDWQTFIPFIGTLFHAFGKSTRGIVNLNLSADRVQFEINATSFPISSCSGDVTILICHPAISDHIFIWPFLTIWPRQTGSKIASCEFSVVGNWTKRMFVRVNTVNRISWVVTKTEFSWVGTRTLICYNNSVFINKIKKNFYNIII